MGVHVSVQICDDHALVRSGLRRLLEAEPGLTVVGEAASAHEAVEQVRAGRPDVLLLDIVMPGQTGIEALPAILEAAPGTKVLMLSMQDDAEYVRQAFAAGATGYLLKEAADTELVQAIHDVRAGRRYLHPKLSAKLAAAGAAAAEPAPDDRLSQAEHEVLRMLALGHTNQEIAEELSLPLRTVENDRERLMDKLGLRTRAELVRYALGSEDQHDDPSEKTNA